MATTRYAWPDILRGVAVIGMILFHAYYLSRNIFLLPSFLGEDFWWLLGPIVGSGFIAISWFSAALSHAKHSFDENLQKSWKRFFLLGFFALSISIFTYSFFYSERISFWILHFFSLVSLISLVCIPFRSWNILWGILLLLLQIYFPDRVGDALYQIPLWWPPAAYYSADYYPLFPWFWVYLIGYGLFHVMREKDWLRYLHLPENSITRSLIFLGKYALVVYLIHVPILYGILFLLSHTLGR